MRRWFVRTLLFIVFSIPSLSAQPAPATLAPSELKADPRLVSGRLENEFRFLILPHANPSGRVSLHLLIEAGSYHETDDERGLAHFVEHMVFNGSRDFPGDDTVKTLQRLGLNLGPDANAYTRMLETGYHLDNLSASDPAALITGLKILRNFADGALFPEAAVRKERKVILAEARQRAGEMAFAWGTDTHFIQEYSGGDNAYEIASIFSDTRVESRLDPMGSEKIISRATAKKLRSYYDRWYRPERMILAVVGDLDAASTRTLIENAFATLRSRTPPPAIPAPAEPVVFNHPGPHMFTYTRSNLPMAHVTLASAAPNPANASPSRIADYFALQIISQRLENLLKIPADVSTATNRTIPSWALPLLHIATPKAHWKEASIALVTEVRRAQQHGFSDEEVAQETDSFRRILESNEREAASQTASQLARELVVSASHGIVFADASTERTWGEAAVATITPASCQDAARRLWPDTKTSLTVRGPFTGKDLEDTEAIGAAWTVDFAPAAKNGIKAAFPYTDFGPPGQVLFQRHDATLDCWFVEFANGVRLTFKPTKFETGQIALQVRFGHGNLGSDQGGAALAIMALVFGGLRDLSFEEIGPTIKKMGAQIGDFSFTGTEDHFAFAESVDDRNLLLGLQIVTAFLTAPAFRESAEARARAAMEPQLVEREWTAAGAAGYALQNFLSSRSPAKRMPSMEEFRRVSFQDLRDSISPQLLNTPLEVAMVGDVSLEDAIAAIARTLGTLPPRPTVDTLALRRTYAPPTLPHRETIQFVGNDSVGSVLLAWTMPNQTGRRDDCAAVLLKTIVEDRLRLTLRQEMGEAYSPSVEAWTLRSLVPSTLNLHARIETAPRHVGRVAKAVREVVRTLALKGATEDEIERARQPLIQSMETSLKNNNSWLEALAEAQSKPQFLVGYADKLEFYRSLSREDINALARTLLADARSTEIRAVPK